MPESVKDKALYAGHMTLAQASYNESIAVEESTEDARGLLPLNIHSPITFSCSYRSLVGLLRQRLCVAAQEEWLAVVEGIRAAVAEKCHPVFLEPLDCHCKRFEKGRGHCKVLHRSVDREGFCKPLEEK